MSPNSFCSFASFFIDFSYCPRRKVVAPPRNNIFRIVMRFLLRSKERSVMRVVEISNISLCLFFLEVLKRSFAISLVTYC